MIEAPKNITNIQAINLLVRILEEIIDSPDCHNCCECAPCGYGTLYLKNQAKDALIELGYLNDK